MKESGSPLKSGSNCAAQAGAGGTTGAGAAASFAKCKGRNFSAPTVDVTRDGTFHEAELRRVMRQMPAKSSLSEVCVRIAGWLRKFEVVYSNASEESE